MAAISISDTHRRVLSSTLGILDMMLCRFERWANGDETRGLLYQERNTLTADQRRTILDHSAVMRRILGKLQRDLGLSAKTENIPAYIRGWSQSFWPAMVELESEYLKRYGDVSHGMAAYLDPEVAALIDHLMSIARVVQF